MKTKEKAFFEECGFSLIPHKIYKKFLFTDTHTRNIGEGRRKRTRRQRRGETKKCQERKCSRASLSSPIHRNSSSSSTSTTSYRSSSESSEQSISPHTHTQGEKKKKKKPISPYQSLLLPDNDSALLLYTTTSLPTRRHISLSFADDIYIT